MIHIRTWPRNHQSNILINFQDIWIKTAATTALTRFFSIFSWYDVVFNPKWPIFEICLHIVETNILTKFNYDPIKPMTASVLKTQIWTTNDAWRRTPDIAPSLYLTLTSSWSGELAYPPTRLSNTGQLAKSLAGHKQNTILVLRLIQWNLRNAEKIGNSLNTGRIIQSQIVPSLNYALKHWQYRNL
jgi:hypothetical protein